MRAEATTRAMLGHRHRVKSGDKMDELLVEVLRGGAVESRHPGSAVVVDADGAMLFAAGDAERPVFTRSTVKALLALPLVESGAADRLGLDDQELALACASHVGLPEHASVAAGMLAKAGQSPDCLECGTHWPTARDGQLALASRNQRPSALHNNCSGKHAGFVCLACDSGDTVSGYVQPEHPAMRRTTAAVSEITGAAMDERNRAIDGCGIPTYAIALRSLATGFARFGSGSGLSADRAAACARLRAAVVANPALVAGPGRFDTVLMQQYGGAVFSKMGAEGVHVLALPEFGLGIAVKCADGASRAAEVAAASLAARYLAASDVLEGLVRPVLRNWAGTEVGGIRPAGGLAR